MIALFGESEKGSGKVPYYISNLDDLLNTLGSPPFNSLGLVYAIQSLMHKKDIIYFKVQEEGYNIDDYKPGVKYLFKNENIKNLEAIFMPKVGDREIIDLTDPLLQKSKSILIISEKDLFDYLVS